MPKRRPPTASAGEARADEAVPSEQVMTIVCAWCKAVMQEGEPPVSHGICAECFAFQLEERGVTDSEHAECVKRPPDAVEGGIAVYCLPTATCVYFSDWAWAFDCRVTVRQAALHFKAYLVEKLL